MCHDPHTCSGCGGGSNGSGKFLVVTVGAIAGSCIESCSGLHALASEPSQKPGKIL